MPLVVVAPAPGLPTSTRWAWPHVVVVGLEHFAVDVAMNVRAELVERVVV
jgi:hypothetical protein